MPKSPRRLNDQDRKWAFVGAMSRKDLEQVTAAVIEQLCMTSGVFSESAQWSGADVCDELASVLSAVGATHGNLRTAKQAKPPASKGKGVAAVREALLDFISTVETTGGIQADPEWPCTDVPVADEDWVDLAEAYKMACNALGRTPKRADNGSKEET